MAKNYEKIGNTEYKDKLKRKPSIQASFCFYSEISFCSFPSLSRNSSGVKTGISDAL